MRRKRKQKWILAVIVTFSVLGSAVGRMAAAAEPLRPAVTSESVTEEPPAMPENESGVNAGEGTAAEEPTAIPENESGLENGVNAGEESERENAEEAGPENETQAGTENDVEADPETGEATEEEHQAENGQGSGEGLEDGIALAAEGSVPSYAEAYDAMIALRGTYPEGMTWTNFEPYGSNGALGNSYTWKGGAVYGANSAVGCMAFAFILSDAAFGSLPARAIAKGNFTFEDVKAGDILRINGNSHSVIVLQKSTAGVTVAEGNYNKSVHWGRAMSAAEVVNADFIITRYPEGYRPWDPDDPSANEVVGEGSAGNLKWSVTKAGVLTVSGNEAIPDYSSDQPSPWNGYDISTIIIKEGVTGIGDYAFYQSRALEVYIPDGVTAIGENAFCGSSLLAVTIPGSVKTIGKGAFQDCRNLTSATVSEGVTTIGEEAFRGCMTLAYIDFPASTESVGAGAFMSCSEMVSVRFRSGSKEVALGDNLFSQCWKLTRVALPQTSDRISAGMFASCSSLPELYIPATIREIGENPFTSCRGLRVIYFGGSEEKWNELLASYLGAPFDSIEVVFDAAFDDPFADDPNEPGDFVPGESEPCIDHVDADSDGKCDRCGATMPVNPDNGNHEDMTRPDAGEQGPGGSGGSDPSAPGDAGISGGAGYYGTVEMPKPTEPEETSKPAEPVKRRGSGKSPAGNKTDEKEDRWKVIRDKADKAEDESTVVVDVKDSEIVPGDVLENIRGRDVTIIFDMGNGVTWSVNGESVREGEIGDIDFSVHRDAETIPADVTDRAVGERYCIPISLAHDGEFGFTAALTINCGKENAGFTAALYYYNENAGELEFVCEDTVTEDGTASFDFTHASDYVIAIEREQEENESVMEQSSVNPSEESAAGETQNQETEEEAPQSGRQWRLWWIIAAAAAVILTGAVIFFVRRKK